MIYVLEDQGSRPYMEDRHYIEKQFFKDYDLMIIFDGHGNDMVAKYSQLYFKDILRNELFGNKNILIHEPDTNVNVALFKACEKFNQSIPQDMGYMSGCTALIIMQNPTHLWIANIGDCRVITNKGSQALQLSIDHKPNVQSEYERIYKAGGFVTHNPNDVPRVNGNLALSRSFGDFYLSPYVTWTPDVFFFPLDKTETDFIFMASDGIFDAVQNHEIVNIMKTHLNKKNKNTHIRNIGIACAEILELARKRGSGDNVTIIVSDIP